MNKNILKIKIEPLWEIQKYLHYTKSVIVIAANTERRNDPHHSR